MKITLSSNALTKIIECSPYYVAINNSSLAVTFLEECESGGSVTVPPFDVRNYDFMFLGYGLIVFGEVLASNSYIYVHVFILL